MGDGHVHGYSERRADAVERRQEELRVLEVRQDAEVHRERRDQIRPAPPLSFVAEIALPATKSTVVEIRRMDRKRQSHHA